MLLRFLILKIVLILSNSQKIESNSLIMINNQRVIAVIPARGGSKSVPKKNIKPLGGKPLICWSIEVAKATAAVDRVIVSTDSGEITQVAKLAGAEVYPRPPHLATDEALVIDTLRYLINSLNVEKESAAVMVLLEPTCPFRSAEDVQGCLEMLVGGLDSVATFKEAELNPHRAWRIERGAPQVFIPGAIPWLPRQQLPKAYQLNGAVYAFRVEHLSESSNSLLFGRTGALIMPPERSVDIDNEIDFMVAEELLKRRGRNA
jgi:N-acylneuraminate cytidylyltransferase